ncbi:MAG: hypothetical protein IJR05_04675 [Acidaminococcaceae bacterium]|nr:hypothetical protein [Acidaminococcaceae bacterium]
MTAIIKYLKEKGQGIVEYALLLSFIVGIAMMLQGGGLGNAVKGVFDNTAELLANFTDSRTPQEKDLANMKKVGEGLAGNFWRNGIGEKGDRFQLPSNYVNVIVLPDGTVDAYIENRGWFKGKQDGEDWSGWVSDLDKLTGLSAGEQKTVNGFYEGLKNAGIDLSSEEGIAKTRENYQINSSSSSDSVTKNGYGVSYAAVDGEMKMVYTAFNSSNVNKDTYKDSSIDGVPSQYDIAHTKTGTGGYNTNKVTKLSIE